VTKIAMIKTALTVGGSAMSDPSASMELEPADSELSPSPASKDRGRVMPLIVGALIGMGIGLGIGIGLGNATRKRIDRFSVQY
jgi:hypothetical protein